MGPKIAKLKVMKKMGLLVVLLRVSQTSLLRRLQAQTLPDATPPLGKNPPFSKIAVTFEPIQ